MTSAAMLNGQSTDGTILGAVTDSSGSAIPAAQVTITNAQTNVGRSVVTDNLGSYEVVGLLPGTYDVLVEAQGFQSSVQRGFVLDARASIRVDAELVVGQVQSKIEVTGATPAITTESGTIADELSTQAVRDLPLNFRAGNDKNGALDLVSVMPGVQGDNGGDPRFGRSVTLAGSHQAMVDITVDGFSIISTRFNAVFSTLLPGTEYINEVSVTTELGDAEIGQLGQVSIIGRGGTNKYHGSLFEYFQNDALDATPLFATQKAQKRANDFGGAIGGPVRFPGYKGKDRTFFFFDWESNRNHTSTSIVEGVPTTAMRTGNFSALCSSYDANGICNSPTGVTLINPFTRQPYPLNTIPSGQINSVSQNILNTFYPMPNFNSGDFASNYRQIVPAPTDSNLFDIRLDEKITDRQSLWGRYSYRRSNGFLGLGLLQGNENQIDNIDSVGIVYDYNIKPNVLNEVRFGYNRHLFVGSFPTFPDGAALVKQLGLDLPGPFPSGSAIPGFIFQQSTIAGTANNRAENRNERRFQINDDLTWIHGRHTIKFGTDIRQNNFTDYVDFDGADNFGLFFFSGSFTHFDVADFLLGLPSQSELAFAGPNINANQSAWAWFAQDQFKITKNLTINFGLRYEIHPPFFDDTLQITNFNPANGDVIVPNAASLKLAAPGFLASINACPGYQGATTPCTPVITAGQAGIPKELRRTDYTKVLPRLSFAYRLTHGWVVRGGASMYDVTTLGGLFYDLVGIHTADVRSYTNSFTGGTPAFQFPSVNEPGIGIVGVPGTADFRNGTQINLRDPYAVQWNLTVERELAKDTGLRLSYSGMRTSGLVVNEDLNQVHAHVGPYDPSQKPFPNWRIIYSGVNGGKSFYNSGAAVLTHRFSHGLTAQSSYYFSKNLSDADGSAGSTDTTTVGDNGATVMDRFNIKGDYGNVTWTRRHRWLSTYVYEIPAGRGKRFGNAWNPIVDALIGNWQTSGTLLVESGPFLTPYYNGGTDPSGTGANFKDPGQRPDRLCNGSVPHPTATHYFDLSCFVVPADGIGRFGNSGVGILTGPGTVVWNAGIFKVLPINERFRLRLEASFTNILNHANLGIPDMNVQAGSDFGVVHSSQPQDGSGNRTGQLGLRLDF
jgi:hypothetical protein